MTTAIIQSHLTDLFVPAKHLSATWVWFADVGLARLLKTIMKKREENQWKLGSASKGKFNSVVFRKEINEKTETVAVWL